MEFAVEQAKDYSLEDQERKAQGWSKHIANRIFAEGDEKMIEYHTKIVEKAIELRQKYPNCTQYRMYHILGGSTPMPDAPCLHYDFEDEDSVELFLTNLFEEKTKAASA
jgi:hypothetical protein